MLKYRTIKAFGDLKIVDGVKYTAFIVGDGRSRVICPAGTTQEVAESYFNEVYAVDPTVMVDPICIVVPLV